MATLATQGKGQLKLLEDSSTDVRSKTHLVHFALWHPETPASSGGTVSAKEARNYVLTHRTMNGERVARLKVSK